MKKRLMCAALCGLGLAGCSVPGFLQPQRAGAPVVYDCEDGLRLTVRYSADAALVNLPEGNTLTLPQQPAGSGIRYAAGPHQLRGKGNQITWAVDDRIPTNCVAQAR